MTEPSRPNDPVVSNLLDQSRAASYDEDTRLVERSIAGDETAFQSLYHRFYNKVFSIAKGILIDNEEAEDAVQEIFTLAYKNLRRFDRRSRFSTWLFRIAVNRSIQQSRRQKTRRDHASLGEDAEQIPDLRQDETEPVDPYIEVALEALQPTDRAVLTLFYWDDLSLQEIGESLGCSANAAKTRLFRARERFKEAYEGQEQ